MARAAHAVQWSALVAAELLTVALLAGCGEVQVPSFAAETGTAPAPAVVVDEPRVHATEGGTVLAVVDGDTLDVQITGGQRQQIRLLGADAPDAGQCGHDESAEHVRGAAPAGTAVTLTAETAASDTDRYPGSGRYVRAGERDLTSEQVTAGWARVDPALPVEATPMLDVMQRHAQRVRAGIWGPLCETPTTPKER